MIVGFIDVSPSNGNWQGLGRSPIYLYNRDRGSSPLDRCVMVYPSRIHLYIKVLIDNDHMVLSGPHRSCASSYLGSWSRVVGYSITLPPWNLGTMDRLKIEALQLGTDLSSLSDQSHSR